MSAFIIIAQSEMKYLMKVNLKQLFSESGHGGIWSWTLFTTSIVRYFLRVSGQFPERTVPATDISPTDSSPNDISPNEHFPKSHVSSQE